MAIKQDQASRYIYEVRPNGVGRHTWSLFQDNHLVREGTVNGDFLRAGQAAQAAAANIARGPGFVPHGGQK